MKYLMHKFAQLLGRSGSNQALEAESRAGQQAELDLLGLPPSKVVSERAGNTDSRYSDYFRRFCSADNVQVDKLRKDDPFLVDICQSLLVTFRETDDAKEPFRGVMRRSAFRNISAVNGFCDPRELKKSLPKVGLMHFPHSTENVFLTNVLDGIAEVENIEPGAVATLDWLEKNVDFAAYKSFILKQSRQFVSELPKDFTAKFPGEEWLCTELASQALHQISFVNLLRQNRWDLVIAGALELEFGMLLHDLPSELRPPIVLMYHGILGGAPITTMFHPADVVVARGLGEQKYYRDMGCSDSSIITIGSMNLERFPDEQAFLRNREYCRSLLGVAGDVPVVMYATTYDLGIYPSSMSSHEVGCLLVELLKGAKSELNCDEILFLLKYHPSPSNEKYFSLSRIQYPLEMFAELSNYGIRLQLVDDLSVLSGVDLFVSHESTTLVNALEAGIGSLSINLHCGNVDSTLGSTVYRSAQCHKIFRSDDSLDRITTGAIEILQQSAQERFSQSESAWAANFGIGKTNSVLKMRSALLEILNCRKTAKSI